MIRSSQSPAIPDSGQAMKSSVQRWAPFVLAGLALAGLGVSAYLTVAHAFNKTIVCGGLGQCDYVNSSEYADVAGIPVAVLGLGLYGSLFLVTAWWLLSGEAETASIVHWGVSLAGAGYAGYLTYVELAVLHAICVWCVVSASILALSLVVSSLNLFTAEEPAPRR
jgi:uncharacterized membrane protein